MDRASPKYQQKCILSFGQQRPAKVAAKKAKTDWLLPKATPEDPNNQSLIILIKSALVVGVAKVRTSTVVGLPAGVQGTRSNHC